MVQTLDSKHPGSLNVAGISHNFGDGNENGKKANSGLDKHNNNFACASQFFVLFFAVPPSWTTTTWNFLHVFMAGHEHETVTVFLFASLNLDIVHYCLGPNVELFMRRTRLSVLCSWKDRRLVQLSSSEWAWIRRPTRPVASDGQNVWRSPPPGQTAVRQRTKLIN